MKNETKRLNLHNVIFTGFLSGQEKDKALASISVLAMPSEFENLGNVILEGLIRKIPCIATKGAPWEELKSHNCGWWIDYSQDAITNAIMEAIKTPQEKLEIMGANGRTLIENNYSIEAISYKMSILYKWILGKVEKDTSFIFE